MQFEIIPNLLYLALVAGLWLLALAVIMPGTGVFEPLALLALAAAGLGTLWFPVTAWALLPIGIGLVLFVLSVYRWRRGVFLLSSGLFLAVGSAFLFRSESGAPAVNLLLATVTTAITLAFFWLVLRSALEQVTSESTLDPSRVLGAVGEARTLIDPTGSAHVGGELWTVRASTRISEGTPVRVVDRDGLMLVVEEQPEGKEEDA